LSPKLSIETSLIRGEIGTYGDPVVESLVTSTTFLRDEDGYFKKDGYIYSRASNPNRKNLEHKLALLEHGTDALAFSSGQAATSAVFMGLGSGSHIILPDNLYHGTRSVLEAVFSDFGIKYTQVSYSSLENIRTAINHSTKLVWIESPSNADLNICDIAEIAIMCKNNGILSVCDNTWATPFFTLPLTLGVDIVMHSTTKFLGGHSDIIGGALIWSESLEKSMAQKLINIQALVGAVPSPFDCWLLSRSLSTLHVRMPLHASNALALAHFLADHKEIDKVLYPGLETHTGHEIAKRQMKNGFGGILSVLIKGDQDRCLKVANNLKIFKNATSLGGVESLVDHRRTAEGENPVSAPNLLRISVGLENINDLISDFSQALKK
jgi:cystathionine gamma-synthase